MLRVKSVLKLLLGGGKLGGTLNCNDDREEFCTTMAQRRNLAQRGRDTTIHICTVLRTRYIHSYRMLFERELVQKCMIMAASVVVVVDVVNRAVVIIKSLGELGAPS